MIDLGHHDIQELLSSDCEMATLKKLADNNFRTVERIMMEPLKNIQAVNGISEQMAKKVKEEASKLLGGTKCVTAAETLAQCETDSSKITTGASELDAILGGGLQRKHITQVHGEFRSGKSTLCHTMCITAQMPREQGGGCGRAIFIDTEGTFNAPKMVKIAEAHSLEADVALANIDYCRVYNYEDLLLTILDASALLISGTHSFIVIDSIIVPFRNDFLDHGELSDRQQELQRTLTALQRIIDEYNIACLITNQVIANPENGGMPGADPRRPVLGLVLSHRSHTIINLKKGPGEKHIAKLLCSPSMPEANVAIMLSVRARARARTRKQTAQTHVHLCARPAACVRFTIMYSKEMIYLQNDNLNHRAPEWPFGASPSSACCSPRGRLPGRFRDRQLGEKSSGWRSRCRRSLSSSQAGTPAARSGRNQKLEATAETNLVQGTVSTPLTV
ncbi:Rad51-domain-containing protein [Pavlovales sp. CCMP2436]|nr:Rad51-domain-containing protein [Pavlovales sp. CCMP2436]